MYRHIITESPNGSEVYVNLIDSLAGHYLGRQPYVINLIKEVLSSTKLTGSKLSIERDMGRVIGNTDVVETSEKDTIFYAQAYKTSIYSRYAKNRLPSPSQKLTIILEQDTDGNYELLNTWIGSDNPPLPGDKNETAISRSYWETHAFVLDAQAVQSKTITKVCPY